LTGSNHHNNKAYKNEDGRKWVPDNPGENKGSQQSPEAEKTDKHYQIRVKIAQEGRDTETYEGKPGNGHDTEKKEE
jgi:hypothetical protein